MERTVGSLRLGAYRAVFRGLEWIDRLRGGSAARVSGPGPSIELIRPDELSLWVFVSTIGELNAIGPFLDGLLDEMGGPSLVLISDHDHYRESFAAKYPEAHFAFLRGASDDIAQLLAARPPLMLIIGEIPCRLHDAPCRFSYATVDAVKRAGAPVVVVNGWLYGYEPSCRMDAIEAKWFQKAYLRAIDLFLVQTPSAGERLVALGAVQEDVVVAGNIKFDAAALARRDASSELLSVLQAAGRPVIVAGCVTELADQRDVLLAFQQAREAAQNTLLVLAPRHPEYIDRMRDLEKLLLELELRHAFRSRQSMPEFSRIDVLVLDTMGELRDFYAVATLAYVGPDHNVLEPLSFGKPVFVSAGWEVTYPSYPVYRMLMDAGALVDVGDLAGLGAAWSVYLCDKARAAEQQHRVSEVLNAERGAKDRCLQEMRKRGLLARPAASLAK